MNTPNLALPYLSAAQAQKHVTVNQALDFAYAIRAFADPNRQLDQDYRWDYGEDRYRLLGKIEDRVFVLVYTPRSDVIRVISARKANHREVR